MFNIITIYELNNENFFVEQIACVSPKLLETLEECETHGEENNESIKELEKVHYNIKLEFFD